MKCKICGKEYEYSKEKGHTYNICNNCKQNYRKKLLKKKAIEYKGGKCQICGYDKCENSLTFHHLDPSKKSFQISGRYNISWERLKEELDKCILLCANCHGEEHAKEQHTLEEYEKWITPQKERIKNKENRINEIKKDIEKFAKENNIANDPVIVSHYKHRKVKRPTYEQFKKEFKELDYNYCAMGRKYGVSDNAIRKWIKSYEKENL